jgi:hypothetical protein
MRRLSLRKWCQGLLDAILDGGSSALLAILGVGAAHQIGAEITVMDYKQIGAVLCAATAVSVARFIQANRSPAFSESDVGETDTDSFTKPNPSKNQKENNDQTIG